MTAVAKFWRENKVLIVMGGILTMGHLVWRGLQNNTAFVPAGWLGANLISSSPIPLRIGERLSLD